MKTNAIALALSFCSIASAGESRPLEIAKRIGNELKNDNWVYGSDRSKKQIDCVGFVLKIVEEHLNRTVGKESRTRILISDLRIEDVVNDKNGIVSNRDRRTKGIQQALVDLNRGEVIALEDAQPGDFVQYWMKTSQNTWFGHAGLIEKVTITNGLRRAFLYGSHKSTNGIGVAPKQGLRLVAAQDRRIYLVRAK